ncbi:MAG: recombinase family protein [Mycoplasmatales bacterium]
MGKIIYGYVRVSSDDQKKYGHSIEHQIFEITSILKPEEKDNFKLVNDEGKSAKNMKRRGITMIINDIQAGKVERVIAHRSCRISRNTLDHLSFIELCKKNNVKLQYLDSDLKFDTAGDILNSNIKLAMNQFWSDETREKTFNGLITKARNREYPWGGKPPIGFTKDDTDTLHFNEKIEIIKKIYEMYMNQESHIDIKKFVEKNIEGIKWTKNCTLKTLNKTIYRGYVFVKGEKYYLCEPIFTEEQIECLKKSRSRTRIITKNKYTFAQKVYIDDRKAFKTTIKKYSHTGEIRREYVYYFLQKENQKNLYISEDKIKRDLLRRYENLRIKAEAIYEKKINELNDLFLQNEISKEELIEMKKMLKKKKSISLYNFSCVRRIDLFDDGELKNVEFTK